MPVESSPQAVVKNKVYKSPAATVQDLEAIPDDASIAEVNLQGSAALDSIAPLGRFTGLRRLNLRACPALTTIDAVRHLPLLERLDITRTAVADLSPAAGLAHLTHLSYMASYAPSWDHAVLRQLPALTHLWLGGDPETEDLSFLHGMNSLKFIDLGYCPVGDLSELAGLPALEELELGFAAVSGLEGLRAARNLRVLGLAGLAKVSDLSPLGGMHKLRVLVLDGCTGISDLTPLAGLSSLETLILLNCTGVTDLSPLMGLPNLKGVSTSGSGVENLPEGFDEELLID